jgi:cytochrome c5
MGISGQLNVCRIGLAVEAILLAMAIVTAPTRPILAAEPTSGASSPSSVSAAGVTLRSVGVEIPDPGNTFPGTADIVNNNCLACHSAGMVLTQPQLSRVDWQAEVDKMRKIYKAPIADADVPAIVDYLIHLKSGN